MKRFIVKGITATILVVVLAFPPVTSVFADSNPSGTGQPNQSCQAQPNSPLGFLTDGFAQADSVYAGSDGTPSQANGSPNAVSQYDVACFQVSQPQP